MKAKDIMTENCVCCESVTTLERVSQLMSEHDCGCIPVVEDLTDRKIIGIITDRDIVCRAVAKGKNPSLEQVGDYMTKEVSTISADTSIKECCEIMDFDQVRRLPVINKKGTCCGIVSQADIACNASVKQVSELLLSLSKKMNKAMKRVHRQICHAAEERNAE